MAYTHKILKTYNNNNNIYVARIKNNMFYNYLQLTAYIFAGI